MSNAFHHRDLSTESSNSTSTSTSTLNSTSTSTFPTQNSCRTHSEINDTMSLFRQKMYRLGQNIVQNGGKNTFVAMNMKNKQEIKVHNQNRPRSTNTKGTMKSLMHVRTAAQINGNTTPITLGCIGAGAMATALINGLLQAKAVAPTDCTLSDRNERQLQRLATLGVNTTTSNVENIKRSKVMLIATKPNVVEPVLKEIYQFVTGEHLIISIAAGVPLSSIEAMLPQNSRVVRVMPNTPSLVSAGASAFALGTHATQEDAQTVEKMLNTVGKAVQIPEYLIDAVTGVSGSGPAYIFIAIEALADGGVRAGLPRDIAMTLASQTVYGAAKMVIETGLHPAQLKDQVCSPGGTTISAVHSLEEGGFRNCLINAVLQASRRGAELALLSKAAEKPDGHPKSKL